MNFLLFFLSLGFCAHVSSPNRQIGAIDPPPVGRVSSGFWAQRLFLAHALSPNRGIYRRHGERGGFISARTVDAEGMGAVTDLVTRVDAENNVTVLDMPVIAQGLWKEHVVMAEGGVDGRVFFVNVTDGVAEQHVPFGVYARSSVAAFQDLFLFHDSQNGYIRANVLDGPSYVLRVRDENFALIEVDAALNATAFVAFAEEQEATVFRGLAQGAFSADGTYVFAETFANRVLALSFTDINTPDLGGIFRTISTALHAPVSVAFDRNDRVLVGTASQSPTDACRRIEKDCYNCKTAFASCGRDSGSVFVNPVSCKGVPSFQNPAEEEKPVVDLPVLGYGHRCVWAEEQAYVLMQGVCCLLGPSVSVPPPAAGVFRAQLRNNADFTLIAESVDQHALDVSFPIALDPVDLPLGRLLILLRDDTRYISLESQGDSDLLMLVDDATNVRVAPVVVIATPLAAQPGEGKGYSAVTTDANFRAGPAKICTWVFDVENAESTTCTACSCTDVKHIYDAAGRYTARVTATDATDAVSAPFEFEVTVAVTPPTRQSTLNGTEDGGAILTLRGTSMPAEITVKRNSMLCVENGDIDTVQYVYAEAFGLVPGSYLFPKNYKPNSRAEQTWLAEASEALDGSTTQSRMCVRVLRGTGTYPLNCVVHCNSFTELETKIIVED